MMTGYVQILKEKQRIIIQFQVVTDLTNFNYQNKISNITRGTKFYYSDKKQTIKKLKQKLQLVAGMKIVA